MCLLVMLYRFEDQPRLYRFKGGSGLSAVGSCWLLGALNPKQEVFVGEFFRGGFRCIFLFKGGPLEAFGLGDAKSSKVVAGGFGLRAQCHG